MRRRRGRARPAGPLAASPKGRNAGRRTPIFRRRSSARRIRAWAWRWTRKLCWRATPANWACATAAQRLGPAQSSIVWRTGRSARAAGLCSFRSTRKAGSKPAGRWRGKPAGNCSTTATGPSRPASVVLGGVLVAETGGDATRLGADSDGQWIAYARGRLLFVKYYFYAAWGDYGPGGRSVEVYFDRRVTELNPRQPRNQPGPRGQPPLSGKMGADPAGQGSHHRRRSAPTGPENSAAALQAISLNLHVFLVGRRCCAAHEFRADSALPWKTEVFLCAPETE